MSKWVLIIVAGLVVGCACWVGGGALWDMLVAMHGGRP
jgi:hypothetical protein